MARRTIKVDVLARVEGEGSLFLAIEDGAIAEARLKIFEPPRFFEAFLRGRAYTEAPDITARICGICPVAYQMSAVHAMERLAGVSLPSTLRDLRRLLYCGEWIESHALHIYLLHSPDFLGYESAVAMAEHHRERVADGLALKKAGNALMSLLGGREIHPINVRVGGFYRAPTRRELLDQLEPLQRARDLALETLRWAAGFDFPDFDRDYEFVALRHPGEYPMNEGRIVSSSGLDIDIADFDAHFAEEHVAHSNALHCVRIGHGPYFVGPAARFALNHDKLSPVARQAARDVGLDKAACKNPFRSILVRGVELVYACDEALRIIEAYEPPEAPFIDVPPVEGMGYGCTEAPRGLLWHSYTLDASGTIEDARIIPPTSQNQKTIEDDLIHFAGPRVSLSDEALRWQCEQAIRNYDPCISCATHFLNLEVERR